MQSDWTSENAAGTGVQDEGQLLALEAFSAYLAARLAEIADVKVIGCKGHELQLRIEDTPVRSNLKPIYDLYRDQPDRLTAIAKAFVEALVGVRPNVQDVKYSQVQDRILPMLKPAGFVRGVTAEALPAPVNRPFLAGLVTTCVIDEPRTVAYVNHEHLELWGLKEDDLFQQAVANLDELTNEESYSVYGGGPQRLLIAQTGDGYDAARVLLSRLMQAWSEQVPGRLLLGLPNRDFLIGFSDRDSAIVRRIAAQVRQDTRERQHSLTDQLLIWQEGRLDDYEGNGGR